MNKNKKKKIIILLFTELYNFVDGIGLLFLLAKFDIFFLLKKNKRFKLSCNIIQIIFLI